MIFVCLLCLILPAFWCCTGGDDVPEFEAAYFGLTPPDLTPEIFAPGEVSIPGHLEYCLTFSPDGKEIYFNRAGSGVFVCRHRDGAWSEAGKPEFAALYTVGELHIYAEGRRMLMNRYRDLKEGEQGGIWELRRIDDHWDEPRFLIPSGMRATATLEGVIYTTDISNRDQEDNNRGNIARYSKIGEGYRRDPDPGGGINTEYDDAHPFIDPQERYVIFNSDRPGGQGKADLYICFRDRDGSWGDAINLKELNSFEGDWGATVSPDGKYMFFTRNIDQNIYWVDARILESYRPGVI